MNLKLGVSRKEGTPSYGSNGASAEIEIELDPDFSVEMVSQASALWHQALTAAVDSQLARMRTAPRPEPRPEPEPPFIPRRQRNDQPAVAGNPVASAELSSPAGSGTTSPPPGRNGRSTRTACGTTADPGGELARRPPGGSCWGGPASTGKTRPSSSWARRGTCPTA